MAGDQAAFFLIDFGLVYWGLTPDSLVKTKPKSRKVVIVSYSKLHFQVMHG